MAAGLAAVDSINNVIIFYRRRFFGHPRTAQYLNTSLAWHRIG